MCIGCYSMIHINNLQTKLPSTQRARFFGYWNILIYDTKIAKTRRTNSIIAFVHIDQLKVCFNGVKTLLLHLLLSIYSEAPYPSSVHIQYTPCLLGLQSMLYEVVGRHRIGIAKISLLRTMMHTYQQVRPFPVPFTTPNNSFVFFCSKAPN